MAPARYSGGDGARPRPHPPPAVMSGRSVLAGGAAAVAVFVVSFAIGNALDDDERPAAPHAPAKQARTTALGPLRLDSAPALPELRAVPARPKPKRVPTAPAGAAPAAPVADSEGVPVETGGYAAPTPTPPVSSSPPADPAPAAPPPPSNPPPSSTDAPQSAAPAPDPAPAPAPVPTPDPSPSGGSGQYSGP
jgi:hypothetical protein